MDTTKKTLAERIRENGGLGLVLKMLFLGLLLLLFLIPLFLIRGLVEAREDYRRTAEDEVIGLWGGEQTVAGPFLAVPYLVRQKSAEGRVVESTELAFFLPSLLEVSGQAAPEKRRRGIYEVTLYTADLHLEGRFERPDFSGWRVGSGDILWEGAYLALELPAPRGLAEQVRLSWTAAGGRASKLPFQPGTAPLGVFEHEPGSGGIRVPLPGLRGGSHPDAGFRFALDLRLNGGRSLSFLPLGEVSRVRLRSSWPAPKFSGAFLPASRSVQASGFEAEWYVVSLGRGYPQAWRQGEVEPAALAASRFGVDLMVPVDTYQKVLRSVKYGILFVLLPFLVFFLFESFSGRKVHPMQYLLVGFAECLFYLLLLSVSEHLGFGLTYLLASLVTIALISFYAGFALGDRRRGLLFAPVLAAAYGFLYAALRSEDYALLIGSLGLFVILAGVMILTRKVDWYRPGSQDRRQPG
jgi:inner membrane protein